MNQWAPSMQAIKITLIEITDRAARELGIVPTPSNVWRNGMSLEVAWRGKSAIKRDAIVSGSRCADGRSGSAAINEPNR